jgi:hypothetical protein
MEDVMAREKALDSDVDTAYADALGPDPVTVGRTLVFEMPKDPDWDDLDQATKMIRKRSIWFLPSERQTRSLTLDP